MAETKDLAKEEYVALAMLAEMVEKKPDQVKKLLESHGETYTGDAEIDFLKIVALTEERGRYFTEDFEEMAANEAQYFGTGAALTIAANLGKKSVEKLSEKLSQIREKKGKEPTKFGTWLKNIFGKKTDGSQVTPQEMADHPDTQKIIDTTEKTGGGGDTEKDTDKDKQKPKPILGMHPALFFSIVTIIIIVIIILIVRAMRKKKKSGEGEAKK